MLRSLGFTAVFTAMTAHAYYCVSAHYVCACVLTKTGVEDYKSTYHQRDWKPAAEKNE